MTDESKSAGSASIDTDLYSRQLLVVGMEGMQRMANWTVLVSGMSGVGVEVAKNIILAGLKSVTIHDEDGVTATHADLASQFYLTESDVGKPRAAACVEKLRELNNLVRVELAAGALTPDLLTAYNMVVLVDAPQAKISAVGDICHAAGVYFIATGTYGLLGYTFVDFGSKHVVRDVDGEAPAAGVAVSIENAENAVVSVGADDSHGLADGDVVVFEKVDGMVELNDGAPRTVKVVDKHSFAIGDTRPYGKYIRGGYFRQVKQPKEVAFSAFSSAVVDAEANADYEDWSRPRHLQVLLRAIWAHEAATGRIPGPADVPSVLAAATAMLPSEEQKDMDARSADFSKLIATAAGKLNPMAAIFGGIAGQEVIKGASGKFSPIHQWFMFDSALALGAVPTDAAATGSRYDGQQLVFGRAFQEHLGKLKYFIVGAGALGCEFLKNFALMGVGCGEGGYVLVTDMDSIEKSNLNRQFLFRPENLGQMKSVVAAAAAKRMNPALAVTVMTDKMCPQTETKYGDAFWSDLDGVCNALDNVQARLYIDSRCVRYYKPLLESGTLGTMANNLTVIPGETNNYGAEPPPPETKYAVCTVKTFPLLIQHTLHWAKELFDAWFVTMPEEAAAYLSQPDFMTYLNKQRSTKLQRLETLVAMLSPEHRPKTFEDCVAWARVKFEENFVINIQNVLHQHPLDKVTDGVPFWSAKKRPPTPEKFSLEDPLHRTFVVAAANLCARMFGIAESTDLELFARIIPGVKVPVFDALSAEFVPETEEERKKLEEAKKKAADAAAEDTEQRSRRLTAQLPPPAALAGVTIIPDKFEKDDRTNRHMDFIAAAGNLRARQYGIPEEDVFRCTQIVGDIIPAIATTTAITTGLVCLELYKLAGKLPASAFRNVNFNVAVNSLTKFEVDKCPRRKVGDAEFTLWDQLAIDHDATVQEIVDHFKAKYGWKVIGLNTTGSDVVSLWSTACDPDESDGEEDEEEMAKTISQLVEELKGLDDSVETVNIELELGGDLEDAEAPPVTIRVRERVDV